MLVGGWERRDKKGKRRSEGGMTFLIEFKEKKKRKNNVEEYMFYIHPELRNWNCHSGTGKGARRLLKGATREQKSAVGEALKEPRRASREYSGSIKGAKGNTARKHGWALKEYIGCSRWKLESAGLQSAIVNYIDLQLYPLVAVARISPPIAQHLPSLREYVSCNRTKDEELWGASGIFISTTTSFLTSKASSNNRSTPSRLRAPNFLW